MIFTVTERREGTVMDRFYKAVNKASRLLDKIAGFCLAGAMVLVVANVVMRRVFGNPFLGVYEYVGFLTAVIIGFSLAYCAVKESHIAVDFLVDRLPRQVKAYLEPVTGLLLLIFLTLVTRHLIGYAGGLQATGRVSPTTETPFHAFVYLVALGFFMLSMTVLVKTIKSVKNVIKG